MNKIKIILHLSVIAVLVFLSGCGESKTENQDPASSDTKKIDSSNVVLNIGGSIFSIPSPIQTTMFIKESGGEFNSDALNPEGNVDNYSSDFSMALILGVYGTDLGYATIFENNDLSLKYLATVRNIADNIGLENAFSESLLDRFSSNLGNKDSMLVFVSEAYKGADEYLKENDKDDVAALVLTGGWIEAMYITCMSYKDDKNEQIKERIAEQQNALNTIIEMLEQFGSSDDYWDLITELEELYTLFNDIEYQYEYLPSFTDISTKTTTINSKRQIIVSDDQINEINEKLISIRNEITQ